MPVDLSIKIDVKDALKALDSLDDPRLPARIAGRVAREVVLPRLMQYPPKSGKKQPFVSDKSRKYFFAALKTGAINVPYRRSGDLGRMWAQQPDSDGMTLTSGMPYSEMVLGPRQAAYFKGTWPTTEQIARACEPEAALAATAELVETIGNAAP